MKKNSLGKFFGHAALLIITIGVMLFLGKHSLNFFTISFTGEDELFAWLGLLLTSGGVIGWLLVFLYLADTTIKRGVTLIMMVIAALGEFATAGFDMYLNAMKLEEGFQFAPEEIRTMATLIALLGLFTGFALIAYVAGDYIAEAFGDEDGDGTPNAIDKDYKKGKKHMATNASETSAVDFEKIEMQLRIKDLEKKLEQTNPTPGAVKE